MAHLLEGKPVQRDIEICRGCKHFKHFDKTSMYGEGYICDLYDHHLLKWSYETTEAVDEYDFVRVTKFWMPSCLIDYCLQKERESKNWENTLKEHPIEPIPNIYKFLKEAKEKAEREEKLKAETEKAKTEDGRENK